MDEAKLFELAVRLAEANINAGQFNNAMNFETLVRDNVRLAYDALVDTWNDVAGTGVVKTAGSDDPVH